MKLTKEKSSPDILIFLIVMILLGIGLVMVYSASAVREGFRYLNRQLLWAVIGIMGMIFFMNFDYHRYRKMSGWILLGSIIGLILVLIPGVGIVVNGSRRWLGFGSFRFQPSEIAKFALVIFLAHYMALRSEKMRTKILSLILPLIISGIVCLLILIEDLGTAVTIAGTVFLMLFAVGVPMRVLISLVMMGIPGVLYFIFSEEYAYRKARILAFLNPWADPLGNGYHIIQSLLALGSGGIFGVGLGHSRQKFYYLPEPNTDFIFAVIGEELGLLGTAFILLLFFALAWRGFQIALKCDDLFGSLLAVGLTCMIILQAIINIAVVTGAMPVTGITLPFISYGGSSLCIMLSAVGILLNISRHIRDL
ncbi:stage V sporulation protein E [Anoxybacter fermentans]|uniref:Probable peptidoglycan glycosyltransferase FtsW n=1 Tax=Anoxybacter fermentans TaxID=1323375 RepID=A0A3S9SXH7_9FIRM|nr:putative lipid II flippase FtsW [Anoxybacter fermentans]AZR73037.1 stage V sporulation protein E [Anoxybacter fermentans]